MKYTFDFEQTMYKRFEVDAVDFGSAVKQAYDFIDNYKMTDKDFLTGELKLPLEKNKPFVRLEKYGEHVEDINDTEIVIDYW